MTLSDFALGTLSSRYVQYRILLSSNDHFNTCSSSVCLPEVSSVKIGPDYYPAHSPTVMLVASSSPNFTSLSQFSATESGGCVIKYQISNDNGTYYYHNGSSWTASDSSYVQSNTSLQVNTNISSFTSDVGTGQFFFKALMNSDGTHDCTLSEVEVQGED